MKFNFKKTEQHRELKNEIQKYIAMIYEEPKEHQLYYSGKEDVAELKKILRKVKKEAKLRKEDIFFA